MAMVRMELHPHPTTQTDVNIHVKYYICILLETNELISLVLG